MRDRFFFFGQSIKEIILHQICSIKYKFGTLHGRAMSLGVASALTCLECLTGLEQIKFNQTLTLPAGNSMRNDLRQCPPMCWGPAQAILHGPHLLWFSPPHPNSNMYSKWYIGPSKNDIINYHFIKVAVCTLYGTTPFFIFIEFTPFYGPLFIIACSGHLTCTLKLTTEDFQQLWSVLAQFRICFELFRAILKLSENPV